MPVLGGMFSDSFEIRSNAPSSPDTVSLSGATAALPVPALNRWGLGLLGLVGWRYKRRHAAEALSATNLR